MNEWRFVALGQISTQRKGINYRSEDYGDQESGHPFLTIKCFIKGGGYEPTGIKFYDGISTKGDHLHVGDILFSVTDLTRAGDIVGSPLKVPDFGKKPALASMDCMRIEPIVERCDRDFLFHRLMLSDVRRQMVACSAGSTVLHLDTKKVPTITVHIPASTKEQEKIAAILNTIDVAIKKTKSLIAKYQQIKAGLMHDLFTRGVTSNGKFRPPRDKAPELYKETLIGWIPKEWEAYPLGRMSEIVSGVTLGEKRILSKGITVPYLRVANVQDGFLNLAEVKAVAVSAWELEKLRLEKGDVLMNEGGDFDKLGRGTVWRGEISDCVHQNHVFRVRPRTETVRSDYLAYWSQSQFGKKYFVLSSKQSTNLASINSTQLIHSQSRYPSLQSKTELRTVSAQQPPESKVFAKSSTS